MKWRILFISAIVLTIYGCKAKVANFVVAAPKGWVVTDTISENKEKLVKMHPFVFSDTQALVFVNNIRIAIVHFPNVNSYISILTEEVKKQSVFYEEIGEGDITINGNAAKWRQYYIKYHKQDDIAEQKTYYIESNGNIFMVVCSAKDGDIKNMQPAIDTVLHSFKII